MPAETSGQPVVEAVGVATMTGEARPGAAAAGRTGMSVALTLSRITSGRKQE